MTKVTLLALALYGLGDDEFQVRQVSEKYLAGSGYDAVLLNRLAPHLTDDLQTRATLKKLEEHYYAGMPPRNLSSLPDLAMLCLVLGPNTNPYSPFTQFWFPRGDGPDRRLFVHYFNRVRLVPQSLARRAATAILLEDLRRWGVPRPPVDVALTLMRRREVLLGRPPPVRRPGR